MEKNTTQLLCAFIGITLAATTLTTNGEDLATAETSTSAQDAKLNYLNDCSDSLYRDYELSLEGFAFGTASEHRYDEHSDYRHRHVRGGAGTGLEFFFCRYIGVEVEGFSESTHHSVVNDVDGNLVLRFPIGDSYFAPYIFGGGGHSFEPRETAYGDGGAGLEVRFVKWFGVFTDGRIMATGKTGDFAMGRVGVKFTF